MFVFWVDYDELGWRNVDVYCMFGGDWSFEIEWYLLVVDWGDWINKFEEWVEVDIFLRCLFFGWIFCFFGGWWVGWFFDCDGDELWGEC